MDNDVGVTTAYAFVADTTCHIGKGQGGCCCRGSSSCSGTLKRVSNIIIRSSNDGEQPREQQPTIDVKNDEGVAEAERLLARAKAIRDSISPISEGGLPINDSKQSAFSLLSSFSSPSSSSSHSYRLYIDVGREPGTSFHLLDRLKRKNLESHHLLILQHPKK